MALNAPGGPGRYGTISPRAGSRAATARPPKAMDTCGCPSRLSSLHVLGPQGNYRSVPGLGEGPPRDDGGALNAASLAERAPRWGGTEAVGRDRGGGGEGVGHHEAGPVHRLPRAVDVVVLPGHGGAAVARSAAAGRALLRCDPRPKAVDLQIEPMVNQ
jgi:hypothetical protein